MEELRDNLILYNEDIENLFNGFHATESLEYYMYKHYTQSFKTYSLQKYTEAGHNLLETIAPKGKQLTQWYKDLVAEGTGKKFDLAHNQDWPTHTRPIVEAALHTDFFLKTCIEQANKTDNNIGWAALCALYDIY